MEINIINYILDKKNISQNQLADLLDPPVSKSILSKWKNGGEAIPKNRLKQLSRIARIGEWKDGEVHNLKWSLITNKSQEVADSWYTKFACWLPSGIDLYQNGDSFTGDFNYDSVWIDNIQTMLITLSDAGVPVANLSEEFTFDPARDVIFHEKDGEEHPDAEWIYTPTDDLLIFYIKAYCELRDWLSLHILKINDKKIGELQFELALKATQVALYHLPKKDFKSVGANLETLEKYIAESKKETFKLISEFSNKVSTGFDYFRYINVNVNILKADIKEHPIYIDSQKKKAEKQYDVSFDTAAERQILDGIKNNEKLLKEILEKLNNLTNKGE